jgi:hypothetical protein
VDRIEQIVNQGPVRFPELPEIMRMVMGDDASAKKASPIVSVDKVEVVTLSSDNSCSSAFSSSGPGQFKLASDESIEKALCFFFPRMQVIQAELQNPKCKEIYVRCRKLRGDQDKYLTDDDFRGELNMALSDLLPEHQLYDWSVDRAVLAACDGRDGGEVLIVNIQQFVVVLLSF